MMIARPAITDHPLIMLINATVGANAEIEASNATFSQIVTASDRSVRTAATFRVNGSPRSRRRE